MDSSSSKLLGEIEDILIDLTEINVRTWFEEENVKRLDSYIKLLNVYFSRVTPQTDKKQRIIIKDGKLVEIE